MVVGRGTASFKIKGPYGKDRPSSFSSVLKPVVFWNVTYRCNLSCIHCYISASSQHPSEELSTNEALRVIGELAEVGVPLVVLSGGEPLVREDFWTILGELRDHGLPVALSTNGTLISKDVAEGLARREVSYVGVSLDSTDPDAHDRFRGYPGAYRKAIEGTMNAKEAGLNVGFRITITRFNVEEALALVDLAKSMGVGRVAFYLLDLTGRARSAPWLLPDKHQLKGLLDRLMVKAAETEGDPELLVVRGNFAGIYVADKLARSEGEFKAYLSMIEAQGDCGRKTISIYPDGRVKPCQFLDKDVGDLRAQRLSHVLSLNNEDLKPFLEVHKHLRGPRCSTCPFKEVCGGGSRGRALAATGDFWGDDPLCFVDVDEVKKKWLR